MAPASAAAQLRSVLGANLGDREIEALVEACNGSVENALNRYFDGGMDAVRDAMKSKPRARVAIDNTLEKDEEGEEVSLKKRRAPSNSGSGRLRASPGSAPKKRKSVLWPKRLCSLAIDAESTTNMDPGETVRTFTSGGDFRVSIGENIRPLIVKPKAKAASSSLAASASSSAAATGAAGLSSADANSEPRAKTRGRPKKHQLGIGIVRLSLRRGTQEISLGRLPRWIASRLHPLMVRGVVRATASPQAFFPESLRTFSEIPIILHIDLLGPDIFELFPDPKRSVDNSEPLAIAFFELCEAIHNPLKYGSVAVGASGNLDFGPSNNDDAAATGSVLTLTEADARGIEETLGVKDLGGAAEDPAGLSVALRPHQRVALRWMLDREDLPQTAKDESLWQERSFRDRKATKYFVNSYTRQIQFQEPPTVDPLRGGILADEMGLGKTVSVIALILASNQRLAQSREQASSDDVEFVELDVGKETSNPDANAAAAAAAVAADINTDEKVLSADDFKTSLPATQDSVQTAAPKKPRNKPGSLIVCPTSLMGQWEAELADKVIPEASLRVLRYHGNERNRSLVDFNRYDCVLTTYGVVASEFSGGNSDLFATAWERVVLDEAHNVKNRTTDAARASAALEAQYRWCLTGTPLQNSVDDIYSLFLFLRYEPWNSYAWWSKIIRIPFEQQVDKEKSAAAMQRLRAVLSDGPVMLRRTKRDVETSQAASAEHKLPEKHLAVLPVELSEKERAFYDAIYSRSKAEFDGFVATGSANTKYAAIFTLLLRMRQACDHPFLVLSSHSDEEKETLGRNGRLPNDKQISDRAYIAQLRERLFACASRGSDLAAAAAASSTVAYIESTLADLEQSKRADCPICLDVPEKAVITSCGHVMCRSCLEGAITYSSSQMACPVCRRSISRLDINPLSLPSEQEKAARKDGRLNLSAAVSEHWQSSTKLDLVLEHLQRVKSVNEAIAAGAWPCDALRGYGERLLGRELRPAQAEPPVKVLIFSQWTKMLDLMERGLQNLDIESARLDGSLTQKKREAAIARFSSNASCNVFLVSLKAGGVGLNLVRASVVFLVDAWWNPQIEEQAIDRVHRIGQTRPVHVYRLVASNTVEQKILALQERKARMANDALQDSNGMLDPAVQKSQKLSMDDLFELFKTS